MKIKEMMTENHKPVIETLINTAAIALTTFGVADIVNEQHFFGFLAIAFGMLLEFFKYYGRKVKLW